MNRRSFLRLLGLGALTAPALAKAALKPQSAVVPPPVEADTFTIPLNVDIYEGEFSEAGLTNWKQVWSHTETTFYESWTTDNLFFAPQEAKPLPPVKWGSGPGRNIPARNITEYLYNTS